ncbi:mitochondrial distribution/morphology family 35/apoptosis, partial [Trametes punicea]
MSQSLSDKCTPLKRKYDACFNAWFEGYLEPAVSAFANAEQRAKFAQEKAAEFDHSCGKIWQQYRECVQQAVKDKDLHGLLEQARAENPLRDPPP